MRRASTSGAATHQDDRAYVELPRQMDFSQNPVEAHTVSAPLPKMQCMMTDRNGAWLIGRRCDIFTKSVTYTS